MNEFGSTVEYSHEGDMVYVRLAGSVDASSAERLDAVLRYVHEAMPCDVTVDLSGLRDVSPAAGFLTAVQALVSRAGRQFVAHHAGPVQAAG